MSYTLTKAQIIKMIADGMLSMHIPLTEELLLSNLGHLCQVYHIVPDDIHAFLKAWKTIQTHRQEAKEDENQEGSARERIALEQTASLNSISEAPHHRDWHEIQAAAYQLWLDRDDERQHMYGKKCSLYEGPVCQQGKHLYQDIVKVYQVLRNPEFPHKGLQFQNDVWTWYTRYREAYYQHTENCRGKE